MNLTSGWDIYVAYHDHDLWSYPTPKQAHDGILHGMKLRLYSKAHGHRYKNNYNPTEEQAMRSQSAGALAEKTIAVGLGHRVRLLSQVYNVPDLPNDIQCRLIGVEHYGLRVYKSDPNHWKIVGCVIPRGQERSPPWRIPGWIYAGDAKRDEWMRDPSNRKAPLWLVPQTHLRDARELIYRPWKDRCQRVVSPLAPSLPWTSHNR